MAFANALAGSMLVFYVVLVIIAQVAPTTFEYLFNAQFFGADLAPTAPQFDFGILITLMGTGWVVGYVLSSLYNRFVK